MLSKLAEYRSQLISKRGRVQMRSSVQIVSRLALLVALLGVTSSVSTSAQQQQPQQPPDMCTTDRPTIIVDSAQKLKDAVNDPDCTEIIVHGGVYELNLDIFRSNLTIKSLPGDRKRPTLMGPLPDRQTVVIAKAEKVTIQGLIIAQKQGNVGILVSEQSKDIKLIDNTIHGYPEAAISIANSQQVELKENRIGGNFEIDGERTRENKVGVRIQNSSVMMTENEISSNEKDGIEITNSTVTLEENTISRNTGCGVTADAKSTVRTPSDDKRNWIFGNKGGNTCPWELSRTIRRPEIRVPSDLEKIQEAIQDAEPVREEADRPYTIHVQPGKYMEDLCIDRSVTIQGEARIRSAKIGTQDCPLYKEEKGNIDEESGDNMPSVRIYISNMSIVPSGSAGFQIGTRHSDSAQKTFLKVRLQDVTIEESPGPGLIIEPSAQDHKLTVDILGTKPLQDADCTSNEYPAFLKGEIQPTPTPASIKKNKAGIEIKNPNQADLTVVVRDVEIMGNNSYGILYEGRGNSQLSLERSRVIENEQGIIATSQGTDPQATDEVTVQLARIWENKAGGVKLESTAHSKLKSALINIDIRKNTGFGVHVQGSAETLLKASSEVPISQEPAPHSCGINDNFGPGVRAHRSAVLIVENMFVNGNGYEDDKKTKPIPRSGAIKAGPDGIFASDSVQLTVRNTYVGPNNAGVGIALQASNRNDQLKATLNDNYIESNRKWGISYIVRSCLAESTMPDNFYGRGEGQNNVLVGNGFRLNRVEEAAGPDQGLGRGQVCPKELDSLIMRVQ